MPQRGQQAPAALARAGFTLIEVLLTLFIMSGILLSITQILRAARISRDTIHNIQETQLAGPAILDMIERDLRSLLVYNRTRAQHLRVLDRVMHGLDGDSIDFVSTTDGLVPRFLDRRSLRSDLNEVGYRLRPSPTYDDFLELYRREDMGIDDDPFEGGEFSFLHDRVKGFDIRVFTEDGPDAEPVDEWNGKRNPEQVGVPARLEITLTLELSPRIAREQIRIQSLERRTQVYKRVIRLPETLRVPEEQIIVLRVPTPPGAGPSGPATGLTGAGGPGEGGASGAPTRAGGQTGTQGGSGGSGRAGRGPSGQNYQTILEGGG